MRKTLSDYPDIQRGDPITADLVNEIISRIEAKGHGQRYQDGTALVYPTARPGGGSGGATLLHVKHLADYSTSDEKVSCEVVGQRFEGIGKAADGDTIDCFNQETGSASAYVFAGSTDGQSLVYWNNIDDRWQLLMPECEDAADGGDWNQV